MRHLLLVVALVAMLAGAVQPSSAQQPGVVPSTTPASELDLRVGALWPEENAQARIAVGGRLALRPWATGPLSRLSLQFTGDFRSLGGNNGFDETFQLQRRITRNRLVVGAALGVDVLRTARTAIEVRAGAAMTRLRTNFLIDSSVGFVVDADEWENVCPFQPFDGRCGTDYEFTPTLAIGMRRDVVTSGNVFVGLDYTALLQGQQILAGTVGIRLR
jgi:hypothetical protein